MELDTERIDEAVLGLLYLTLHDGNRAWKGMDWDALDRLHAQGLVEDPVSKAKSVVLTLAAFYTVRDDRLLDHSPEVPGLESVDRVGRARD
ncbi:MAG: DUF6429 family protein [Lautropia sp.]